MTALHQTTRQAAGLFRVQLPTSVLSAALYDPAGLQQAKADRILAAYEPDMVGEFLARPGFQFLDDLHRYSACVLRGYDGPVIVAVRPQNSGTTLATFTDRRTYRAAFTAATPTATSAAFSRPGRAAVGCHFSDSGTGPEMTPILNCYNMDSITAEEAEFQ